MNQAVISNVLWHERSSLRIQPFTTWHEITYSLAPLRLAVDHNRLNFTSTNVKHTSPEAGITILHLDPCRTQFARVGAKAVDQEHWLAIMDISEILSRTMKDRSSLILRPPRTPRRRLPRHAGHPPPWVSRTPRCHTDRSEDTFSGGFGHDVTLNTVRGDGYVFR